MNIDPWFAVIIAFLALQGFAFLASAAVQKAVDYFTKEKGNG